MLNGPRFSTALNSTGARWYRSRVAVLATAVAAIVTSLGAANVAAATLPSPHVGTQPRTVVINSGNAAGTNLTLTSKTIEVPPSAVKSVGAGGATYTFASATGPLAQVAVGKVILIEGQDAIVVTSVKHSGAQLIVGATPASIGDVIESGQLVEKGPPDMAQAVGVPEATTGAGSGSASAAAAVVGAPVVAGARRGPDATLTTFPTYSYKGKGGSFSYSISLAGAPDGIHVTGSICYACSSLLTINAKIDGTFTWADQDLDMGLASGKVKSGSFGISGLSSDLDLTYTVLRGEEPGAGAKPPVFKLPVSFEAPLCICGGIPVYSKFQLALLVTLGLGAKNSTVEGGAHVTISGSGSVSGTGIGGASGSWTGGHVKGNFITGSALTPAAAGIVVALQAKFGVGIGVKDVNALYYIAAIFSLGETTGALVAGLSCVAFDGDFSITGNAEAQLLGLTIATPAKTLFDKKESYKQPPC